MNENRVCPVERAGILDMWFRRFLHNPQKILRPYISEGMTVLDLGCGPGYFTLDIARMVGASGKVIAADLQAGMLEKLRAKIERTRTVRNIVFHQCTENTMGVKESVDFILMFYVFHEITHPSELLREMLEILKPGGKALIAEPNFHVSRKDFSATISLIRKTGFEIAEEPRIFISRSVVLQKRCP